MYAVVSGLDNFAVGMRDDFPRWGLAVDTSSYTICGQGRVNATAGYVLDVPCPSLTRQFRHVIVQSLDSSPESFCLAEVAVYCGSKYAVTFLLLQRSVVGVARAIS